MFANPRFVTALGLNVAESAGAGASAGGGGGSTVNGPRDDSAAGWSGATGGGGATGVDAAAGTAGTTPRVALTAARMLESALNGDVTRRSCQGVEATAFAAAESVRLTNDGAAMRTVGVVP